MTIRIWIDTELGTHVDDALALASALRHPELELVGTGKQDGHGVIHAGIGVYDEFLWCHLLWSFFQELLNFALARNGVRGAWPGDLQRAGGACIL